MKLAAAKWLLVILTVDGGPPEKPYPTAEACQRALRHVWVSPTREAFCMSLEEDVLFYMRDGKHIAEIR